MSVAKEVKEKDMGFPEICLGLFASSGVRVHNALTGELSRLGLTNSEEYPELSLMVGSLVYDDGNVFVELSDRHRSGDYAIAPLMAMLKQSKPGDLSLDSDADNNFWKRFASFGS